MLVFSGSRYGSAMSIRGKSRRVAVGAVVVALYVAAPANAQVEGATAAQVEGPTAAQVEIPDTIVSIMARPSEWSFLTDRPAQKVRVRAVPVPVADPVDAQPAPAQEEPWTDAWGQEKNFGLAAAEAYLGNFFPWAFNEIVPGRAALLISQISPRSWWRGMTTEFGWDDNQFAVNMFAHPFQGSIYYNSARGNGFNYFQGFLFALAGSYLWECCGETHLPSINDWINTSIGGAAMGEMLYRTSSMVLDNTARGSGRAWREAGALLINPTRGVTRLVTGNMSRVYANPENPNDRIPDRMDNLLAFGSRFVGVGRIADDTKANAFFDMDLTYGSLLGLTRNKPFDFFTLGLQLNFNDKKALSRIQIRGNLWHKDLRTSEDVVSKLIIVQDFDYIDTNAYEFGGQSIGALFLRRGRLTDRIALTTQVYGSWMIMGAVNSEYSFAAEIPGIRERLREYDFGSGAGGRLGAFLLRDGSRWIDAEYRVQWLNTLNGSNANGEDAYHVIQDLRLRFLFPLKDRWGVGIDGDVFWRHSYFTAEDFENVTVRSPQLRVFATWHPTREN